VARGASSEKQAEMRRTIAAAMSRSKREIPHYYLAEPIPMERALTWLAQQNAPRPITERVLPAALLLKGVARALERYPEFNGFYRGDAFEPASGIHLGVAVALRQGGLVAPALFDTNRMTLSELMRSLADLVQRARAGTLRSSELSGASITVTNLGDQGAETAFGVIYPPQVALVGFGRVVERPWAENGAIRAARIVTASLSADHRVSDGHQGARLLAEVRDILQTPEELVQGAPT
jgi:pyruvate dehydrogenase E2 component (dihydrolipoamide acetyltransferase)